MGDKGVGVEPKGGRINTGHQIARWGDDMNAFAIDKLHFENKSGVKWHRTATVGMI